MYLHVFLLGLTGLVSVYLLFFILLSKLTDKAVTRVLHPQNHRIKILIPARAEHSNTEEVAIRSLMQSYRNDLFEVTVIADGLSGTTLLGLQSMDVNILPLDLEVKTNGNAIKEALKYIDVDEQDIIVIVDPSHVLEFEFLEKINDAYNSGHLAIQAHRTPKKRNSLLSRLIMGNEEINHSVLRKGPAKIGLNPTLIGAGMAFNAELFAECCSAIDGERPFHQEIDIQLRKRGIKTHYLTTAKVFMEKTPPVEFLRLKPFFQQLVSGFRHVLTDRQTVDRVYHLMTAAMPSKLLIWVLNAAAAFLTEAPIYVASTAVPSVVCLLGIPSKMYRAQVVELAASLPQFLRLMFIVYGRGDDCPKKYTV